MRIGDRFVAGMAAGGLISFRIWMIGHAPERAVVTGDRQPPTGTPLKAK
jgi:hypothetical protein